MNKKLLRVAVTTAALSSITLSAITLSTGCSVLSEQGDTQTAVTKTAASALALTGEQAIALRSGQWLAVSPDEGLQFTGLQNDSATQFALIKSEYLDVRARDGKQQLLTLNTENQLVLLQVDSAVSANASATLSSQSISSALPWSIEGLCLYQPATSDSLQAFVLDDTGTGHQLLLSARKDGLKVNEIREFPLPPASEYCAVDDRADRLYVTEENIGLWVYNARAESELSRDVVDMVAPWGQLNRTPGPMTILNGELLMAETGSHLIHRYQLTDNNAKPLGQLKVTRADVTSPESNADLAIESLFAGTDSQGNHWLSFYDDESGELLSAQLSDVAVTPDQRVLDLIAEIAPNAETTPVATAGDAADDPAIWVNQNNPAKSLVLGTNKKRGLVAYTLKGQKVQDLPVGRVNNVDIRHGFALKGEPMDIAAASHRDHTSIALFAIDPQTGKLSEAGEVATTLDNVYGFCMYQSDSGVYAFINDEDGRYEQYRITDSASGWQGEKVREFAVATQPEGCAADDRHQRLFVGEEGTAVWTLGAEPDASTEMTMLAPVSNVLHADIEGMDLYHTDNGGYLVVSSQGNDSYVVFNSQPPFDYIGRFRVGINSHLGIDGASETDGLTVTSLALGSGYPEGLLVVQDGRNLLPNQTQNFKLIDWRNVSSQLKLK